MKAFFAGLAIVTLSAVTMQAALTVPAGVWATVDTTTAGAPTTAAEKITSGGSTAYWNNQTDDSNGSATTGVCRNIGCFVTGIDPLAVPGSSPNWNNNHVPGSGDPVYLASNAAGVQQQDFYFSAQPTGPAVLLEAIAGFGTTNWVGWYDVTAGTAPGTFTTGNEGSKWGVLFTGNTTFGTTAAFTPPLGFGIWMLPSFNTGPETPATAAAAAAALTTDQARFSQSTRNIVGTGKNELLGTGEKKQYFTAFARNLAATGTDPARFVVGIEDSFGGDNDFNDLVFSMTVSGIPEPGYYVLLSLGLFGLGVARRRMKNTVN